MAETSRIALDLIRADEAISWVRDQFVASFSEGIAQSAKNRSLTNAPSPAGSQLQLAEAEVTQRERTKRGTKREKYETSRPYEEPEKIELIAHGLHEVFVTIPAVQLAATRSLLDLGASSAGIEFSAPDEEENVKGAQNHSISMDDVTAEDLRRRFAMFKQKLES